MSAIAVSLGVALGLAAAACGKTREAGAGAPDARVGSGPPALVFATDFCAGALAVGPDDSIFESNGARLVKLSAMGSPMFDVPMITALPGDVPCASGLNTTAPNVVSMAVLPTGEIVTASSVQGKVRVGTVELSTAGSCIPLGGGSILTYSDGLLLARFDASGTATSSSLVDPIGAVAWFDDGSYVATNWSCSGPSDQVLGVTRTEWAGADVWFHPFPIRNGCDPAPLRSVTGGRPGGPAAVTGMVVARNQGDPSLVTEVDFGDGVASSAFAVLLRSDGSVTRSVAIPDFKDGIPLPAAIDGEGGVVIAGLLDNDPVDFGTGPLQKRPHTINDAFVARLDPNGRTSWAFQLGVSQADSVLVAARGDDIVVSGRFAGELRLGPVALKSEHGMLQGTDAFLLKLDLAGAPKWGTVARPDGAKDGATIETLALDSQGHILFSGTSPIGITLDFGSGPIGATCFVASLGF